MSHVCLSSGLVEQCQSSVRFSSLVSREQPITWDVMLYRESRTMGLLHPYPSAAAALAWTGELHTGEGSSDLRREKSPPDARGKE